MKILDLGPEILAAIAMSIRPEISLGPVPLVFVFQHPRANSCGTLQAFRAFRLFGFTLGVEGRSNFVSVILVLAPLV